MAKIITVNLDKERHLKLTMNSLAKLEKLSGVKLVDMTESNASQLASPEFIIIFLYCALIWEDKTLTLEDVGDMIDLENVQEVMEKLQELMFAVK